MLYLILHGTLSPPQTSQARRGKKNSDLKGPTEHDNSKNVLCRDMFLVFTSGYSGSEEKWYPLRTWHTLPHHIKCGSHVSNPIATRPTLTKKQSNLFFAGALSKWEGWLSASMTS